MASCQITNSSCSELRRAIHGGDWQGAVDRYGWRAEEILDFSANINPLGLPDSVLRALQENLKAVERYPDPYCRRLKQALGRYLGLALDTIIAANGAVELIYLICQTLKPRRVLITEPTFGEYRRAALMAGAELINLKLDPASGFFLDPIHWGQKLKGVDMAFICNPNNPTSQLLRAEVLQEILVIAQQQGVFLVVDESFIDFLPDWSQISLGRRATGGKRIFVIRSLTKIFAFPGLRVGFGIADPELILRLEASRQPWSVNILAQIAAEAALANNQYLNTSRELVKREKDYLYQGLANLAGFQPFYPEVNFILTDISASGLEVSYLSEALSREKILIRDCSSFMSLGSTYFRTAVRDRKANNKLLTALREILPAVDLYRSR